MRILVAFGLLLALVAVWLVTSRLGDQEVPPPVDQGGSSANATAEVGSPLPPGTVAQHAQRDLVTATDLAPTPTACLAIVDHGTGRPVAGAAVRRVRDGAELAFTDEQGLAAVPLSQFEQLAVVAAGYLLRLAPTRPGSTEAEPQLVRLVADVWSPRVRLSFRSPAGTPVREAFVRFRGAARPSGATPPSPVPAGDPVLERAWVEHAMLAGRPVGHDAPVELGDHAPHRVHRLADGAEVRFVVPGDYDVEVATLTGLVGREHLVVATDAAPAACTIPLRAGGEFAGTVVDQRDGTPLAGATVALAAGDPLGLVATTGPGGAFRLAPVWPGPHTLHVRHPEHEPLAHGPEVAPAAALRLGLAPLPRSVLRGRVRLRPDLAPIGGATVAWQPNGATAAATVTAADGTFLLRTTGTAPARVWIQAPGCLAYAELVEPGAPFADYDVWPGTTMARLERGLTGVLAGVVVDAAGVPQPDVAVRWQPAQPTTVPGSPGRRVLEGAALALPTTTVTSADGSFALETPHLGAGRLALVDTPDAPGGSVEAEAKAGATTHGIRLRR
ncbi:MAG: carboxypeptidase regulatory-like domain-containing protein [Planctomycetes bacterium]|nr:carboxypeptidase regulatory-like domain-containing protein [Planctomycetota bacterium]